MKSKLVTIILCWLLTSAAQAQAIVESNFQHMFIESSKVFLADDVPKGRYPAPLVGQWLRYSTSTSVVHSLRDRNGKYLSAVGRRGIIKNIKIRWDFDEGFCSVGFRLKAKSTRRYQRTERSHFVFTFFDRDGTVIDQLNRWPARGTTRQAYSVGPSSKEIWAVSIENVEREIFGIREIRGKPCSYLSS